MKKKRNREKLAEAFIIEAESLLREGILNIASAQALLLKGLIMKERGKKDGK